MDYEKLGNVVRKRRKAAKLTQETLAERIGICTSYMGHIERGTRVLSVDVLHRICTELDVSADELLGIKNT